MTLGEDNRAFGPHPSLTYLNLKCNGTGDSRRPTPTPSPHPAPIPPNITHKTLPIHFLFLISQVFREREERGEANQNYAPCEYISVDGNWPPK